MTGVAMPYWAEMLLTGIFGLIIGGFIPTVVYRVPRQLSLAPLTACTTCSHQLSFLEEIPMVSWLALRGHCRHCGAGISLRYPLIEGANTLLYLALAWRIGFHWQLPAYLAAASGLLALGCIDWQHHRLPREISVPVTLFTAAMLTIAAWRYDEWRRLAIALGLAVIVMVWFATVRVTMHSMGFGDVLLAPLLGLILGWISWDAVFVGVLISCWLALGGHVLARARRRVPVQVAIPLGSYLATGTLGVILVMASGVPR